MQSPIKVGHDSARDISTSSRYFSNLKDFHFRSRFNALYFRRPGKRQIKNRAFAWWNTKSGIPPNAFIHSIIIYALLTTLACTASSDIDVQLILAGALLGIFTEGVVGLLSNATLRLSRPNAVMIRLLTPILILPWAIIVDMLSS